MYIGAPQHQQNHHLPKVAHNQVAVLEKSSSTNLFRVPGCYQFPVEVVNCNVKAAIDTLGNDRRVEVGCHGRSRHFIERQQTVEDYLYHDNQANLSTLTNMQKKRRHSMQG